MGENCCIHVTSIVWFVIQTGVLIACPSIMLSMALDDECEDALEMKAMIIVPVWMGIIFGITSLIGATELVNMMEGHGDGLGCCTPFLTFLGGFMVLLANGFAIEFNQLCPGDELEYEPFTGIPPILILAPVIVTSTVLIPTILAVLLRMFGECC